MTHTVTQLDMEKMRSDGYSPVPFRTPEVRAIVQDGTLTPIYWGHPDWDDASMRVSFWEKDYQTIAVVSLL